MDKIVYIVGAGFSRSAGIPTMADFLFRAKDMYFREPAKYKYLGNLFQHIDKLNKIKSFYYSDLFNIEEILSIMEMQEVIGSRSNLRRNFIQMIIDVVHRYSYQSSQFYPDQGNRPGNWYDWVFSENRTIHDYSTFIASLMGLGITLERDIAGERFRLFKLAQSNEYSVISFNYDMIFEMTLEFFQRNSVDESGRPFRPGLSLSKLHGSVHDRSIVPPTWAKSIQPNLRQAWKNAFKNIQEANQLRIVGYSLPITDSYFRYFLKSAIVSSENLRSIDVMCFDPSGDVEKNFREFISFSRMRFSNTKFETFLTDLSSRTGGRYDHQKTTLSYAWVEDVHSAISWN